MKTPGSAVPVISPTGFPAGWLRTALVIAGLCGLQFAAPGQTVRLQTLPGQVPAAVAQLTPVGRPEAAREIRIAVGLPLRHAAELTNLLQNLYDPASPDYHHYLTPAQFAETFGPTREDYESVLAFARTNGLTVTATHPNRTLLDLSGSVANLERTFHVTLRTYVRPSDHRVFYAPDGDPALALATPVLHVSGLDNYSPPQPRLRATPLTVHPGGGGQVGRTRPWGGRPAGLSRRAGCGTADLEVGGTKNPPTTSGRATPLTETPRVAPPTGSGPAGTLMGNDFRAAYAPGLPLTGTGQTVGLLQFDGYTASDITYYESNASLPNVTLVNVLLDGFDGRPSGNGNELEVSLDIEAAIAMAPGLSQVIVYEAGPAGVWDDILNRMATDDQAQQISSSWYLNGAGPDPVADQIWQQMAAQGQSFFSASGDHGADLGPIDFPGESPYITQVGGTTLTTGGPGGAWVSETVWNWNNGAAGSGGISTRYGIPSWQAGINMTANGGSTTQRNVPDVALTADNVYVRVDGEDYEVGGTSCAAPLWAGFMALVNQQAVANGRPSIGFANPAIYALGREAGYTLGLHDIMTGSNVTPFSLPGKFLAVPGYDLCTGWGTPTGSNLVNALVAPADALQISPGLGFIAVGAPGGPFTPSAQTYSLKNAGAGGVNWTLAGLPAWLSASATSGQLKPAGFASLAIGLNSAATNLPLGTYAATLSLTNLNDGVGQSRQFFLQVAYLPVAITQQPTNQAILAGGVAAFTVAATGNDLTYQWQKNGAPLTDGGRLSGSATSTLTVSNATVADAGIYSVIVSNPLGAVTSAGAGLTLYTVGGGEVVLNGGFETGDFSDWTRSGNTDLMSVTTNTSAVHSGAYGAQSGASDSPGWLSQTLPTVPGAAYLISLWLDSPDGAAPNEFSVQWNGGGLYEFADLPAWGWTNLQFLVTATGTNTVLALGLRDDPAYLGLDDVSVTGFTNVASPPLIVVQPARQAVAPGGSATFSVVATGSAPLGYYWRRNGSPIAGATQPSYTDYSVAADAGSQFSCLVSNQYGVLLSATVGLTVGGSLYVFTGPDGGSPQGGLVQTAEGSFYGTTTYGGADDYGTVFKIATNGALTTLVSFNYQNGANPAAGLAQGPDGNLYGTTEYGGTDEAGTVFKITTNGVLTSVVSFQYFLNGGYPFAGLLSGSDGNWYGTTSGGGTNYDGTVFKLTPNGVLTTLVAFNGTNGADPVAGLIQGANGTLYGTTAGGGLDYQGTLFSLTTNGGLTTLVSFNFVNGDFPQAGLFQGTNGTLYGTTEYGGLDDQGTVFSLTTNGLLTTLVSFNGANGADPMAGLVQGPDGNLYGTTTQGGDDDAGILFRLAGDGTLTTILSLTGAKGATPEGTLVAGLDGNLYGTTTGGGFGYDGSPTSGDGTVLALLLAPTPGRAAPAVIAQPVSRIVPVGGRATFSVQANASTTPGYFWQRNGLPIAGATQASYTASNVQAADSGSQFSCLVSNAAGASLSSNAVLTVLPNNASGPVFSFSGFDGGGAVSGLLLGTNGIFYGTTEYGGTNGGYGTIFSLTTNGGLTTLFSFDSTNGAYPLAGLTPGTDGNLYGTTPNGGNDDAGTVFKMTPNGQVTTLVEFSEYDGAFPAAGLVLGTDGNFYGTTTDGGVGNYGTVFQLTPNGVLTTLVSFNNTNGADPLAGLVQGTNGNFYGTTEYGGTNDSGTVFEITTNGMLTTLVAFNYYNGGYPKGGLVQDMDGNFHGTTSSGGRDYGGTVFQLTPSGQWTTLAVFGYDTGTDPAAGLVLGADGNFYGTTESGGVYPGVGTVFQMTPAGVLTTLFSFANTNGDSPQAALVQGPDGNFYGTTSAGGAGYDGNSASGDGVIFRVMGPQTPPVIVTQPASLVVPVGGTASFSVSAAGSAPRAYSWERSGTAIAGATNSSYTTNNVQWGDSDSQFSCLVTNAYGSVTSSVAVLTVTTSTGNLVQNGGFELGSFADWTTGGNTSSDSVTTNPPDVHSGLYGARLGPAGSLGYLSQTLATTAGQAYVVSCWLDCDGGIPNEFSVAWNGTNRFDEQDLGAVLWTNLQFTAMATSANTVLTFGFLDDPGFLGLDDVSVYPVGSTSLDHFAWSPIASPQGAARPFSATITAEDDAGNVVTNFTGTAALSGSMGGGGGGTNQTILGFPAGTGSGDFGTFTVGYAFTPSSNLTVTEVLSYFGAKVSIWTAGGVLLAAQNVAGTPGAWVATPLTTPLTLMAGNQYVAGVYTAGASYYWRTDLSNSFPAGIINQSYEATGDAFPTITDNERWWLVSLGYTVGSFSPVTLSPTNAGPFISGVWNGRLAVQPDGSNLVLTASDGAGHVGSSNPFNVIPGMGITPANGALQISIAGSAGEVYRVLASTNLMTWQTIATVTNRTGVIQFIDPAKTNFSQRFYQEVAP